MQGIRGKYEKIKKENEMKNSTKARIIAGGLAVALLFITCAKEPKEDPIVTPEQAKDQSATLNDLFGEGYTATVKGKFTDTEWAGVADKVKTALNDGFNNADGPSGAALKSRFRNVFSDEVTIIVEKTTAYDKYKVVTGEFRTLYLNINALVGLQADIGAAITAMSTETPTMVQLKKQNRVRFGGAMSPYELAQFKKSGNIRA